MENQYYYIYEKDYDKELSMSEYSGLGYFSKSAMNQRYPKGGFIVLGGIGCDRKETLGYFYEDDKSFPYYERHSNRFCYGVEGYISLGQNQYIAIEKKVMLRHILFSLMGLILIGAFISVIVMSMPEGGIDRNAKDYTPPEGMNIQTDPNHIALPGYDKIEMNAGTNTAYVALWNPPSNPCYFKFKIKLTETEEVLFESDLIPPGKAVTSIEMSQSFEKGLYPVTIDISTFSLEDKDKPLNGGVVNSTIVAIE